MDYYQIYNRVFKNTGYGNTFMSQVCCKELQRFLNTAIFTSILDVGAGRGYAAKVIKEKQLNCHVVSMDLQDYRTEDNKQYSDFIQIDLTKISSLPKVDAIVCLGVLEHIEEDYLSKILSVFSKVTKHILITIAINPSIIGGVELHVTKKPKEYWEELILNYFDIVYFESKGKLLVFQGVARHG